VEAVSFSLDANLLLYAVNEASPEHPRALAFLKRCAAGTELVCLAWPTVMAFLRIATHPAIFPAPLSWREASDHVDALLGLPHLRVLSEQEGFWEVYRSLSAPLSPRGNLVTDAHIAAILKQNGVTRLFTNDADFRRFPFLAVENPLA
jgi:toxin-antitoxin system PIN domain toxin